MLVRTILRQGIAAMAAIAAHAQPAPTPRPDSLAPRGLRTPPEIRTIAVDQRLVAREGVRLGDTLLLRSAPAADTASRRAQRVVIGAVTERNADPSEVARSEYRVRLHLDALQSLIGYGDRVDRFAVQLDPGRDVARATARINAAAFGFRAHASRDIAVTAGRTFQVVERFHTAIGIITIVASAIFLLCILLLKVDERRRDVAALRLMGLSRATVARALTLEAAAISLLGSALGAGLGSVIALAVNWYYQRVYDTPLVFAVITRDTVVIATLLSLVLGVLAGLGAAYRLVRTPPLALFGR
ncbi:MAG: FtsX-like permease family protein [Gemmatimonadaceae bacterium]|jgi:putative ABC transport system permease protein|nr:FtsX-like permease family protein [Gemmatimonadaceae bacterium]